MITIFGFYFSTYQSNTKKLELTKNEINAVEYIELIYHLGKSLIELKNLKTGSKLNERLRKV